MVGGECSREVSCLGKSIAIMASLIKKELLVWDEPVRVVFNGLGQPDW